MRELLGEIPLDPLVYEAGGLIFFFALLGFARTTRRLLNLTGGGWSWLVPLAGALCMIGVVVIHFYANVYFPLEHAAEPPVHGAERELSIAIYRFRFIALLAMLASSIATLTGAVILWMRFTGFRIRG
jgi:hypothetical protein